MIRSRHDHNGLSHMVSERDGAVIPLPVIVMLWQGESQRSRNHSDESCRCLSVVCESKHCAVIIRASLYMVADGLSLLGHWHARVICMGMASVLCGLLTIYVGGGLDWWTEFVTNETLLGLDVQIQVMDVVDFRWYLCLHFFFFPYSDALTPYAYAPPWTPLNPGFYSISWSSTQSFVLHDGPPWKVASCLPYPTVPSPPRHASTGWSNQL